MHQLTEEIIASKEWRIRELEALKKIGIIAQASLFRRK